MRVNLLGPLEVRDARNVPVRISGFSRRAAFAFLVLRANEVVPTSRLLTALWGNRAAPATARKVLQNAVAGLRAVFSGYPVELVTQPPGYVLRVDPDAIDATRFHRLAEQGRAELARRSWDRAAAVLGDAQALWRGPVLADLAEAGVAWAEIPALRNARLAVLEDWAEAALALGRHQGVLAALDPEIDLELPRERMSGQLMLALYRSGRQAEALEVYRRTRNTLVQKLGLDPGRELRDLEAAILAQDPALDAPAEVPAVRSPSGVTAVVVAAPDSGPAVRSEVERCGGELEASIGSLHLALFGDPDTAVRAALAIRDDVGAARIAVATGAEEVAPNTCLRLLETTAPGEIRISGTTPPPALPTGRPAGERYVRALLGRRHPTKFPVQARPSDAS